MTKKTAAKRGQNTLNAQTPNPAQDRSLEEFYDTIKSPYSKFASQLEYLIKGILDAKSIKYLSVSSRVKEKDSFLEKCKKDKYDDPINQIMDLIGCRIILYKQTDVASACKLIEDNFELYLDHYTDKHDDLGVEKVGYISIHYVCSLDKSRMNLIEFKNFSDIFEIQIRTILQHAWADINHGAVYKGESELPHNILRRFSLLAGLLELADREFVSIDNDIDAYISEVREKIKSGNFDISLNDESLKNYLELIDFPIDGSLKRIPITSELRDFGIKSIGEFQELYDRNFKAMREVDGSNPSIKRTSVGLLRTLMLVEDVEKYLLEARNNHWSKIRITSATKLANAVGIERFAKALIENNIVLLDSSGEDPISCADLSELELSEILKDNKSNE